VLGCCREVLVEQFVCPALLLVLDYDAVDTGGHLGFSLVLDEGDVDEVVRADALDCVSHGLEGIELGDGLVSRATSVAVFDRDLDFGCGSHSLPFHLVKLLMTQGYWYPY